MACGQKSIVSVTDISLALIGAIDYNGGDSRGRGTSLSWRCLSFNGVGNTRGFVVVSVLPILHYPDERVRQVSEPVDAVTDEIQTLIDDMVETMYAAPGVGLAAPQVGVLKRIAVIDITVGKEPDSLLVMINPEILSSEDEESDEEGCLSVPSFTGTVKRTKALTVRYLDRKGEEVTLDAEGFLARAVQHEIDHLNGTLFIDRLGPLKRDIVKRKIKKAIRQGDYEY
jgi:peptide deformylase